MTLKMSKYEYVAGCNLRFKCEKTSAFGGVILLFVNRPRVINQIFYWTL